MPIRYVDRRSYLARLAQNMDGVAGNLQGTHVAPPGRTGTIAAQLGGVTPNIVGGFTSGANRTGSIVTSLDDLSSSISGTFAVPGAPITATKYVANNGTDSASNGAQGSPFRTIAFGLTQITAGQSLGLLTNITESFNWATISGGGAGSANHKVVKAITPGLVISGNPSGTNLNTNLTFQDVQFSIGTGEFSVQFAEKMVFIRCGITGGGGTNSGNVVQWTAGNNQAYHGMYGDGTGGRYVMVVFQCSNVLLNECVVRTQANVWGPPGSNPTGGITVYSCPNNVLLQNCIAVDCQNQGNGSEWLGGFNFVSNVGNQAGIRVRQCIALDNAGLIGIQVDGSGSNSVDFTDCVSVRNDYGAVVGTHLGSASLVRFIGGEYSANTNYGVTDFGNANSSVNNLNTSGNGLANFNGISGAGNTTAALNMASRVGGWKRYGTTYGLLYGETGYDVVTAQSLWPFPNEALIRSKFAAVSNRGFCGGAFSLTSYVQR